MSKQVEITASNFDAKVEAFAKNGGDAVDVLESLFQHAFDQVPHGQFSPLNKLITLISDKAIALPRGVSLSGFEKYLATVTVAVPATDGTNELVPAQAIQLAPKSHAVCWACDHNVARHATFVAKWWTVRRESAKEVFDMEALARALLKMAKSVARSADPMVSTLSVTTMQEMLASAVAAVPNETKVIAGIAGSGRTAGPSR